MHVLINWFKKPGNVVIALFLVAVMLLFSGLGSSPIYILDEARNAQCAREMMERNDWVIPTFNGELRGHKPPLHYYFMRVAYEIFGTNAFAARFFSAVMGLLTIFITYLFTKKFLGKGVAIWTTVVLVASTHFLFEFRLAVPDPYLIFFITAGIFLFYNYTENNSWISLLSSAVFIALAILAKGPVALALPAAAIGLWLLYTKKWNIIFSWKNLAYLVVVAAVAVPWFVKVHAATKGQFTRDFFFTHNINRFSSAMEGHGGLFIIVPLFVFIGLLPLSVFLWEPLRKIRNYKNIPLVNLALSVVLLFVLFFCLSGTKLPNYPMPCYPFAAMLLGYWINRNVTRERVIKLYPLVLLLIITVLLAAGAFIGIGFEPALAGKQWWAIAFIVLPVTAFIALLRTRRKGLTNGLTWLFAGYTLFNFLFLVVLYNAVYRQNPVALSMPYINNNQQVIAYKIYNPAFNFYLDSTVYVADNISDLSRKITPGKKVVVITRQNHLEELQPLSLKVMTSHRDLFETPTTVLLQPADSTATVKH